MGTLCTSWVCAQFGGSLGDTLLEAFVEPFQVGLGASPILDIDVKTFDHFVEAGRQTANFVIARDRRAYGQFARAICLRGAGQSVDGPGNHLGNQ